MDMTREDAREILTHNWTRVDNPNYSESKLDEAIDMAIDALSAEESVTLYATPKATYVRPLTEEIAIEFLQDSGWLPNHDKEIGKTEPSDLISRADAMGAVQDHFNADGFKGYDDGQKMMDRIKALPSVSAERVGEWEHKPSKSGEWIWWQCSKCGAVIYSESEADRKIHHAYCGVCGAKMKGGNK